MDLPDFQNAKEWLQAFSEWSKKSKILTISILFIIVLMILGGIIWPIISTFIDQKPDSPKFLIANPFIQTVSTIVIEAENDSANSNRPLKIEFDGYAMKNAGKPIPDTNPQKWNFTLYDNDLPHEVLKEGTHEFRFGFYGEDFSKSSKIFITQKAHIAAVDIVKKEFPIFVDTEVQTVEVKSARELIEAIQPNRTIKLKAGTYNLSLAKHIGNNYVKWVKTYDGYEPIIHNLYNLTIVGEDDTKIVIKPRYSWVINFQYCRSIKIQNVTIGHINQGYCGGGVLSFTSSDDIQIENSILFGSGTYGMQIDKVDRLKFSRSTIKECSYGLVDIYQSANINFVDSVLDDTGKFNLISIHDSSEVKFNNCLITGNWTGDYLPYLISIGKDSRDIYIINSTITDNTIKKFVNHIDRLVLQGNVFENNSFSDFSDNELRIIGEMGTGAN